MPESRRAQTPDSPLPVVLVGVHGHGRWHLANIRRLEAAGTVTLAGVCDRRPPKTALVGPDGTPVPVLADLATLLGRVQPAVTVICTPIHTHVDLALEAMAAGSHVLLEKPPAPSLAEHRRLVDGAAASGLACQIGFQDLGSAALPAIRSTVDSGLVGAVRGVGAAGAWVRDGSYWSRSPWAGRRSVDGVPVVDGALTNPFAHAVAAALAIDGSTGPGAVASVEVELHRANEIEADDTSCVRVRTARGVVTVAATLCAERDHEPYVLVHGSRGRITLSYKRGDVRVQAPGVDETRSYPRTDLLENLVAHARDRSVPLLVPPESTDAFMAVVEAVRTAPEPAAVPARYQRVNRSGPYPRHVVGGVDDAVDQTAETLSLFSELGLPWAAPRRAAPRGVPGNELASLEVDGRRVASYLDGSGLARTMSPRPFLHPVTTLGGTPVTDVLPEDHRWHLGVSVAVQDVAGRNLWGGRTYLPGKGYTWREDHGAVRHAGWEQRTADSFDQRLEWVGPAGELLVRERRQVTARAAEDVAGAWVLEIAFTLGNMTGEDLALGSPATNGRAGAGYGGLFWRLPRSAGGLEVFAPDARGEAQVHGRVSPWVAVSGTPGDPARAYTLVLAGGDERTRQDPWFVRLDDYPGIGSSLAAERPLRLPPGGSAHRRLRALVADGVLPPGQVDAWARRAAATPPSPMLPEG